MTNCPYTSTYKCRKCLKLTTDLLNSPNFLRLTENTLYCLIGFIDFVDGFGIIKNGDWKSIVKKEPTNSALFNISSIRGFRCSDDAVNVGEALMTFLASEEGQAPWQIEYIQRTPYSQ